MGVRAPVLLMLVKLVLVRGMAGEHMGMMYLVEHNMFERCYDLVSQLASTLLSCNHTLPSDYYNTNKMIMELGLLDKKIDPCKNSCILYWKDGNKLDYCKFCSGPRYKLIEDRKPRHKKSPYAIL
ncbi:UNVERIFIED_CONTAM: hypothetical protein Sradi_2366700, partial [Sesamum radiatum]